MLQHVLDMNQALHALIEEGYQATLKAAQGHRERYGTMKETLLRLLFHVSRLRTSWMKMNRGGKKAKKSLCL